MKSILLIASVLLCMSAQAQDKHTIIDKRLKSIDKKMDGMLDDWHAAGMVVAVVENDKVIYAKGFGYKDFENKLPVTTNTQFAIGSSTKAFTATLIGQLAESDDLDIDKSPREYMPELKFFNDEMNNQITIRDMMCHRTGLPRHGMAWYQFSSDSKLELVKKVQYQEPSEGVRQRFQYNNFMFGAQGLLVEKLTGNTWEKMIDQQIFKPLGMTNSSTSLAQWLEAADVAKGYGTSKSEIKALDYYDIAAMAPAGSINSSAWDMTQWLKAWLNRGTVDGIDIFSSAYYNEAIEPQIAIGGSPGTKHPDIHSVGYGLGWFTTSYRGHYRVEHGGNIDGFSASVGFYPSDGIGIVVLVNQNNSSIPAVVRNTIADKLLGLDPIDWNEEKLERRRESQKMYEEIAEDSANKNKESEDDEEVVPSHPLAEYAGSFKHPGYGTMVIESSNDSLYAVTPKSKYWLKPAHYDVFQPYPFEDGKADMESFISYKYNFQCSDAGEISAVKVNTEGIIEFKRMIVEMETTMEELQLYVGEYALGGQSIEVFIKESDGLFLTFSGQNETQLIATKLHKFAVKGMDGFSLEFVVGEDRVVSAVKFAQPNGTFEAQKTK